MLIHQMRYLNNLSVNPASWRITGLHYHTLFQEQE